MKCLGSDVNDERVCTRRAASLKRCAPNSKLRCMGHPSVQLVIINSVNERGILAREYESRHFAYSLDFLMCKNCSLCAFWAPHGDPTFHFWMDFVLVHCRDYHGIHSNRPKQSLCIHAHSVLEDGVSLCGSATNKATWASTNKTKFLRSSICSYWLYFFMRKKRKWNSIGYQNRF